MAPERYFSLVLKKPDDSYEGMHLTQSTLFQALSNCDEGLGKRITGGSHEMMTKVYGLHISHGGNEYLERVMMTLMEEACNGAAPYSFAQLEQALA